MAIESVALSSGAVVDGVHVMPLRVFYEDTDAAGIVYYANYLKFTERARTELLRLVGLSHSELWAEEGLTFAVKRCALDYVAPARLDDEVEVHTRVLSVGGASLNAEQIVRRDGHDLVRTRIRIACVDGEGRARRLPARVRDTLERFIPANP